MLDNIKMEFTLYQYRANTPNNKLKHSVEGFIFKDNDGVIFEVGKKNTRKFNKKLDIIYLEQAFHDDIKGTELDNFKDLSFSYLKNNIDSTRLCVCLVTTQERLGYLICYNDCKDLRARTWKYYDCITKEFKVLDNNHISVIKWAVLNNHHVWFRPYLDIPIMQSSTMSDVYQSIVNEDTTSADLHSPQPDDTIDNPVA